MSSTQRIVHSAVIRGVSAARLPEAVAPLAGQVNRLVGMFSSIAEANIEVLKSLRAEALKAEQLSLFGGHQGLQPQTVQVGGPHPHQQVVWKSVGDKVRAGAAADEAARHAKIAASDPKIAQHLASTADRRAQTAAAIIKGAETHEHNPKMGSMGKTPAQMVEMHHQAAGGLLEHETGERLAAAPGLGLKERAAHAHARAATEWAHVDGEEQRGAALAATKNAHAMTRRAQSV